jgi:hypothetical protein
MSEILDCPQTELRPQCTPRSESKDCPQKVECLFCSLGVSFCVFESKRARGQGTGNMKGMLRWTYRTHLTTVGPGPDSPCMVDHLNYKYGMGGRWRRYREELLFCVKLPQKAFKFFVNCKNFFFKLVKKLRLHFVLIFFF